MHSDDTFSAEDVVLGYRQLLEVEAVFRTLKSSLDLRPMYRHVSDRIRAHVLICWLALLLVKIAEIRVGESWAKIRSRFERIRIAETGTPNGRIMQRAETSSTTISVAI